LPPKKNSDAASQEKPTKPQQLKITTPQKSANNINAFTKQDSFHKKSSPINQNKTPVTSPPWSSEGSRGWGSSGRGRGDKQFAAIRFEDDIIRNYSFILTNDASGKPQTDIPEEMPQRKPARDYSTLCVLPTLPKIGDLVAFKMLELHGMSPVISDFKEGTVETTEQQNILIRLDKAFIPPPPPPPEPDYDEYGEEIYQEEEPYEPQETVYASFTELIELKLITRDGKDVPVDFFKEGSNAKNMAITEPQMQEQQVNNTPHQDQQQESPAQARQQQQESPAQARQQQQESPAQARQQQQQESPAQARQQQQQPQPQRGRGRRRGGLSGLLVTLRREQETKKQEGGEVASDNPK